MISDWYLNDISLIFYPKKIKPRCSLTSFTWLKWGIHSPLTHQFKYYSYVVVN